MSSRAASRRFWRQIIWKVQHKGPQKSARRAKYLGSFLCFKANTFVFHIVGVDVGFENPMFAALEVDYEEADNDVTGNNQGQGFQSS